MLNNATGFRKIYIAAGYMDLRCGIAGRACTSLLLPLLNVRKSPDWILKIIMVPFAEVTGDILVIVLEMERGHADACPLHIHRLYYVSSKSANFLKLS